MTKNFELRREVELAATPEQVWEAMTTEAGTAGWIWPMGAEPRVGGAASEGGTVTIYDPPNHFAVRTDGPNGTFNALEYIIAAREGGTTTLRIAHTAIYEDDWAAQYEGAAEGWNFYLHNLDQYLRHFPNQHAAYVAADGPPSSSTAESWPTLKKALGISDDTSVGDEVRIQLNGLGQLEGVVDYFVSGYVVGIRTGDGLYRFENRTWFGSPVMVSHHVFASGADAEKLKESWKSWLDSVFA